LSEILAPVAVVTGASSGIGAATVRLLVERGWHAVGCDISPPRTDGPDYLVHDRLEHRRLNVADRSHVAETFAAIVADYGRVDALVNVAAVNDGYTAAHHLSDALWDRVIGIDLSGPFYCARAVLPTMLEQGGGRIINVSSVSGLTGAVSGAAYTAAKHGVIGLTRSIAATYREERIRCNAVCPGSVATNISETDVPSDPWTKAKRKQWWERANPSSSPTEVASMIAYLLSDEAASVNGAIVTIDGGWTA
jgi:NAD(P)-dependent dehydrogenase (short-subunit alcohol dehydrogenase family)